MMGFGMMGGGLIGLIIIVVLVYMLINNNFHGKEYYRENNALEILNQRFARGEITEEEYQQKKKMLRY